MPSSRGCWTSAFGSVEEMRANRSLSGAPFRSAPAGTSGAMTVAFGAKKAPKIRSVTINATMPVTMTAAGTARIVRTANLSGSYPRSWVGPVGTKSPPCPSVAMVVGLQQVDFARRQERVLLQEPQGRGHPEPANEDAG